jgi:hypothetical protein
MPLLVRVIDIDALHNAFENTSIDCIGREPTLLPEVEVRVPDSVAFVTLRLPRS